MATKFTKQGIFSMKIHMTVHFSTKIEIGKKTRLNKKWILDLKIQFLLHCAKQENFSRKKIKNKPLFVFTK